jgi:hypothetical protein
MPRESVVDALNTIHRTLRPGGILLDVHPLPAPAPLELRPPSGTAASVGQSEYSPAFNETITLAEKALELHKTDGLFIEEKHTDFDSVHHFSTAQQWAQFRDEYPDDFVPATDDLVATVAEAFQAPGTHLLMAERARATRYRAKG